MSDVIVLKEELKRELLRRRFPKAFKVFKKLRESESFRETLNIELCEALLLYFNGDVEGFKATLKRIAEEVVPSEAPELSGPFSEVLKRYVGEAEKEKKEPAYSVDEFLSVFTFMEDVPRDALEELVKKVSPPKVYKKGEYICREGEKGDRMYFILKGEVVVTKGELWLSHLSRGDLLGEMAFFSDQRERTADVVALTDVEVFELSYEDMEELFSKFPGLRELMKGIFLKRLKESIVASSGAFKNIKPRIRKRLAERGEIVHFKAGDVVLEGSSESNPVFIVSKGKVAVYDQDGVEVVRFAEGDMFGGYVFPFRAVVLSETAELMRIDVEDLKASFRGYEELLRGIESAFCKGFV